MWQPTTGGPSINEVLAILADANKRLTALSKEVVYLNGVVWELTKKLEGYK